MSEKKSSWIEEAVNKFRPIMYLEAKDKYRPLNFNAYINEAALKHVKTGVIVANFLDPIKFARILKEHPEYCSNQYTLFLPGGLDSNCIKKWQPSVEDIQKVPLYVHVYQDPEKPDTAYISYTHMYAYNGPTHLFGLPLGEHYADLEHVTVEVEKDQASLNRVYFSKHNGGSWVDKSLLIMEGQRPVVFSARNSHASYEYPQVCSRFYGAVADIAGPGIKWDVQNLIVIPDDPAYALPENAWLSMFEGSLGNASVTSFKGKSWWNNMDVEKSWNETYFTPKN